MSKRCKSEKVLRSIKPVFGYMNISEDRPPQMWNFSWYADQMPRADLKHIKVKITPVLPKKRKRK